MTGVPACERVTIEEIFARDRSALVALAFLVCGSETSAEDIVQTAFATAQPRWHTIERPTAYLKRAVVNLAADGHRRRFRERKMLKSLDAAPTANPDIDNTWLALHQLPATQRAVVVLRYYEDLPLTEIAEILDRPAATIRSDLLVVVNVTVFAISAPLR